MEMKNYVDKNLVDMEETFKELWDRIEPYTMTSIERGYALYKAVKYVVRADIPGALVECGVWKGGSCMLMAEALLEENETGRELYLYDTYEGMPEPSEYDCIAWNGQNVFNRWRNNDFSSWAVSVEEVRNNLRKTDYPESRLHFVEGDVKESFKSSVPDEVVPDEVALLRLDTDWYESTLEELKVLYPKLNTGGVLILDDYGHFTGAKKAVDDYFDNEGQQVLLNRIDYTGRIGVKVW